MNMIPTISLSILVALMLMNTSNGQNCETTGCSPGYCCSKWGFCGNSELHCTQRVISPTIDTSKLCNPPCGPGSCCSSWGFCGNSELHCAGRVTDPTIDTSVSLCNPPCRPGHCCSKWGFCGDSPLHCSAGTTATPITTTTTTAKPTTTTTTEAGATTTTTTKAGATTTTTGSGGKDVAITREQFDCIFGSLSADVRAKRWQGYQEALALASFKPQNENELIMFFSHVAHETDGLQTYVEYCGQSGACADHYQDAPWCPSIKAAPGKKYFGRGWFQLSWPCNYNDAGKALGIDLLENPETVAESDVLAAATAMWYWNANNMGKPAREGNFGESTHIINSIECGATPQQTTRVGRYQQVRSCFGLPEATENLRC